MPPTLLLLTIVLYIIIAATHITTAIDYDVVIGVSLSLRPLPQGTLPPSVDPSASVLRGDNSHKLLNGLLLWDKKFGQDKVYTYGDHTVRYSFQVYEDHNNASLMVENYRKMSQDSNITVLVGPIQTDFTLLAMSTWADAGKMMVSTTSTSLDVSTNNPWSFSLMVPYSRTFISSIPVWTANNVRRIAIISENVVVQSRLCDTLPSQLATTSMEIVFSTYINTASAVSPEQTSAMRDAVYRASLSNPDILVVCSYNTNGQTILEQAQALDFAPKAIWFSGSMAGLVSVPQANYVYSISGWMPTVHIPADGWYGTPQDFTRTVYEELQIVPDIFVATTALMPILVQESVKRILSNTPNGLTNAGLRDTFAGLKMNTFYGNIGFTQSSHINQHDNFVLQMLHGAQFPVAPLAFSSQPYVFPMPSWQERVFAPEPYFDPTTISVAVFAILLSVLTLILFIFTLIYWRNNTFLLFILVGAILCHISPFVNVRGGVGDNICRLRSWPFNLGYVLFFAPIVLLAYRERALASKGTTATAVVSRSRLLKVLAGLVFVMVLLLLLITFVSPQGVVQVSPSATYKSRDYLTCSSPNQVAYGSLAIVLLFYKAAIALAGIYFCWRIYSYSRRISVAFIFCCVFLTFTFIIDFARIYGGLDPELYFGLNSYAIFIGIAGATIILFWTRLKLLARCDPSSSDLSISASYSESYSASEIEMNGRTTTSTTSTGVATNTNSVGTPMMKAGHHHHLDGAASSPAPNTNEAILLESLQIELEVQRAKIRELEEQSRQLSQARTSDASDGGGASAPSSPLDVGASTLRSNNATAELLSVSGGIGSSRTSSPPRSPAVRSSYNNNSNRYSRDSREDTEDVEK
eukprot:TRINITY_DN10007_c0_g1_i1.p1 TRINITY_DN10007_c0_g1~~TRINITY_DN10007_c0_g1_i1.p1  ORF type:complete len:883 (-),score=107.73 TRINITY_DN10007_c0_g1_i1:24-2615(-)